MGRWTSPLSALLFDFASLQTLSHSFYNLLSTCRVLGPTLGSVREHRSDCGRSGLCSVPLMVKAGERTQQPRWLPPGIDAMESTNLPNPAQAPGLLERNWLRKASGTRSSQQRPREGGGARQPMRAGSGATHCAHLCSLTCAPGAYWVPASTQSSGKIEDEGGAHMPALEQLRASTRVWPRRGAPA